jgi:catecholate siderophore receptor
MALIISRKHAPSRLNQNLGTALAAMLMLPAGHALAADNAATDTPPPQQTLPAVNVSSTDENAYRATRAASPKYTEPLLDTAQTITVIKKELIEQQGATTLTDALRNTPGVGTFFLGENGSTNTGDAIYMRGFDASSSIYVDNVRDIGSISRDVFNIEQIDVLKGPAGTDSGRGSPTGSINLSSKQPTLENAFTATATGGSGQQKRVTADWNRVIDADSGTAFRLNLMDQDSGNPARDVVKNKRWGVAPELAFGLGTPTRIYLDYLHIKQNNIPDGGVPTIGLPGYSAPTPVATTVNGVTTTPPLRGFLGGAPRVDPSNFYGSTSDHDDVKVDMFTARVEHDFAPNLKFQNTTRYGDTQQNYLLSSFMTTDANIKTPSATDLSTWTTARTNRTVKDQENKILTNQSNLTAELVTGVFKHALVGGLELTTEKQLTYGYTGLGVLAPSSLYHPNPDVQPTAYNPVRNGASTDVTIDTQSVYLFDTIKYGEDWMLNLGGRFDHFNIDYRGVTLTTAATPALPVIGTAVPTSLTTSDTLFTGKVSLLYKPTKDSSVYGLYASSKQPPGGSNFTLSTAANSAGNTSYEPQETTTKEVGTKWDFLQQKLSFTAALYRTDVKNEVEQDPTNAALYFQTGKKRVEGVELGVTGEIVRNWLVSAGYTHMKTTVEAGKVVTANGENNLTYTPKDAFTSWTTYTLPFGLQVGGGVRYVGKLLRGTDGATGTPAYADAYWVADAMLAYPVSKNVDLRVNVYNITDKDYIAAINKSGYRYTPGAPRSASLTASVRF